MLIQLYYIYIFIRLLSSVQYKLRVMIYQQEESEQEGNIKFEEYGMEACFRQNNLKLQVVEGTDKIKYEYSPKSPKPQEKKVKKARGRKRNPIGPEQNNTTKQPYLQFPSSPLPQKTDRRITPVEQRAKKILINYSSKIEQESLIFYKKTNYRGTSVTEIIRPQNQEIIYLSKRPFPFIVDTHNSIHQITTGKLVNALDPTYSESGWKVLNKERNTCNCTKSHCQKSYCQCFLNKRVCGEACGCIQCKNTQPHFKNNQDIDVFLMGCQCNKSQCITSYCRCKKLEINCGEHCRCSNDCKN